ncbi:hypothetical protein LguiA_020139 [Lonicera macranthoides]
MSRKKKSKIGLVTTLGLLPQLHLERKEGQFARRNGPGNKLGPLSKKLDLVVLNLRQEPKEVLEKLLVGPLFKVFMRPEFFEIKYDGLESKRSTDLMGCL